MGHGINLRLIYILNIADLTYGIKIKVGIKQSSPLAKNVEIEDQQYPCSNQDQSSVRLILGSEEMSWVDFHVLLKHKYIGGDSFWCKKLKHVLPVSHASTYRDVTRKFRVLGVLSRDENSRCQKS
jgi:hypothetical protein